MNTTAATSGARTLAWCLHLLMVGLLGLAAGRAVVDADPRAPGVVAAAAALALAYAAGGLLRRGGAGHRAVLWWLVAVGAVWVVLLVLSADGVWLAFPLYFLHLHVLPRRAGLAAVAVTTLAAILASAAHQGGWGAGTVVGPALGAAVAVAVVWSYQALYRESERRRRLIEELTVARADLAAAQHAAGVLAERERLAREIHDTLAQGLSSIQLLLRAAGRTLPDTSGAAAGYVEQARQAAADNLAEARRFVTALTPPALEGTTLADALRRLCATTSARDRLDAHFHLTGEPVPLPTAHEVALLRVAQSALANAVRHADASTAEVTLGYLDGQVALDVVDDGTGFDPRRPPPADPDGGGFGLPGARARVRALGGTFTVRSAPGHGTTLSARLPVTDPAPDVRVEAGP
ncbi:sensor histidine kinase [Micromonospora siamensis]|uniref:Oxygen sensor histidine kinase NreB n=1 Tax=Micromonospora siamensis TaxID=299152 RepID=A0A1C5IIR0_9ACTN|nr:sensor histidine kinase [Micromonospora siamensis]SCG57636.1 Signal transduction histidine kinase [Micromonospora siamensis]